MPVYTADDLVSEAIALGYADVSKRLIYDWSGLGLLDHPTLYSPGRRGRHDAFPESQRQLFLVLLQQRKHRTKQILGLSNVPVFVWLWWGDDYISLRQVRCALRTWGEACLADSRVGAQRAATYFLNQLNLPRYARGRLAVKLALEEVILVISTGTHPDEVDWDGLESRLVRVWSKELKRQPRGPVGAQLTPAMIVTLLRDRYRAIVSLNKYDDTLFEWARWVYRAMHRGYALRNDQFSRDPELGHLHRGATAPEHIANHACLDLLTTVGTAGLARQREGTLWDPRTWREHALHLTGAGEVQTKGGVIVPARR